MAILTKSKIIDRIKTGDLKFTPVLDVFQLRPHAVDLRLGYSFLIPKSWHMTPKGREILSLDHFDKKRPQYFDVIELEQGQFFDLLPGEHVIVSTLDKITMPIDVMAVLYPRSSINRKGLSIDLTGIVDGGYEGQLVMPVKNNTAHQIIRLYPGERFCQLVFQELGEKIDPSTNRYSKRDIADGFIRSSAGIGDKGEEEIELIQKGDIKNLKEKYKID